MVPEILGTKDRIFVILHHFVPFDPPNNQKNQNLEKIKTVRSETDVIVLHICSKSHDNDVWFPRY